jgi:hypothetical protein
MTEAVRTSETSVYIENKVKAVPLHAMKALGGEEV